MAVSASVLGVPGYSFDDLHDPERLSSLYERFCEQVGAENPALWREWDAYRRSPDAPYPPVALSNLLIAMAAHVSAFVKRLFDVDRPARAVADATRAQDALFRFKVDFVRRRALPLLKGGAHLASAAGDDAVVEALSEIHYCVLCHERDKDSCSKGLHDKDGKTVVNALGIELQGCPLDEKISEMHALRKGGDPVGALALVAIDNPMCPGTGHRIC